MLNGDYSNEPAVTKAQQRIKLDEDIVLFDTPNCLEMELYGALASTALIIAVLTPSVTFFAGDILQEHSIQ